MGADRVGLAAAKQVFGDDVIVEKEVCFIVAMRDGGCNEQEENILKWLFAETFEQDLLQDKPAFKNSGASDNIIVSPEFGPRLSFQTAWGSNAVAVVRACGVESVERIEKFRRYRISNVANSSSIEAKDVDTFGQLVHDRMTEAIYAAPIDSFEVNIAPQATKEIDVLNGGESALRDINRDLGLGFDDQDIAYYLTFFRDDMKRNPTDVELFDLAQSNSEHSRHWFFNAKLVHDGIEAPDTLMDIVRAPLRSSSNDNSNSGTNSVIAFADNSSSIRGYNTRVLRPSRPGKAGKCEVVASDLDILCTAETHNFPSGVAPFPGAETGTGGRIRDSAATGIGSLVGAGLAGYAVGNLHIPGNVLPWEGENEAYPSNLASPLQILIDASNGASDYGNKFGEPVIAGFARTYGLRAGDNNNMRREYIKPIMFSGGIGYMEHQHARKGDAEVGLVVVKIGGPAYRIGLGGGAASSMTQGDNRADLDFNAVQRGDAQMEQKAYRVIRACVELGKDNPIVSLHDQGAGGNCNVVKELIYPEGAKINLRNIWVGDRSLSALEIWGAEYQEQFGLLLEPRNLDLFKDICRREGTVAAEIGVIDGSKRIVLWDQQQARAVADMDLEKVLGKLPQKTFVDARMKLTQGEERLALPAAETVMGALERVLRLMSVGSKRFLTTKVDRSVTGLVAQQQTVGKFQLPLADAGVLALSHFEKHGVATALGERPSLTTLSPAAMARMSVAEMLLNLGSVRVSSRTDIKCEGNWMWAAKLPGDGAMLYDAAVAMRDVMIALGIALDGGKDSLSMAANTPDGQVVRAPGTLVMTAYCSVPDITHPNILTPDIKRPGASKLVLVDIADGRRRLGGSALAQVYASVGDTPPDIDDFNSLKNAFDSLQALHSEPAVLAYHDVSDGGLLVAALEMAFAGNCGLDIQVDSDKLQVDTMHALFAEEAGVILEVENSGVDSIISILAQTGVRASVLASTQNTNRDIVVRDGGREVLREDMMNLLALWEKTSFLLERQQANNACVESEERSIRKRTKGLNYTVPFAVERTAEEVMRRADKPKVAILREEGSNGDREMAAAFHMAGFEAWDVSMNDLKAGKVTLDGFRGAAFVGGFSYADVFDSAKGWAGVIKYSDVVRAEVEKFYARDDTFSLGVCNGCQLMALLGKVPGDSISNNNSSTRFVRNNSERYESRFVTVRIDKSEAVMLRGMEGAQLGVWIAHGEGRAYFPDGIIQEHVDVAPLKYVDDHGNPTMEYPYNPNGSDHAIAGLCSPDGRHLAMMPHPERSILEWQWPYYPAEKEERSNINNDHPDVSPWIRIFQNARAWCDETA